jgi:hypothetical protein
VFPVSLYTQPAMPERNLSSARRFDRPLVWWSAAAGTLLLGFLDLARGGETIAPILLVIGYLVLVPIAIMRS